MIENERKETPDWSPKFWGSVYEATIFHNGGQKYDSSFVYILAGRRKFDTYETYAYDKALQRYENEKKSLF